MLILIVTVIYSCRKDKQENATEQNISDPQLLQVKQWYETNYNRATSNGLATQSTTSALNAQWDHIFSPAWAKVNTFTIDSITYYELPVVKTHGDFAISRKDIGNAKYDFSKSMSRSAIILRKSKTGYGAYLMTIVGDSSYLNGDFSKLANNTYQKKDETFSGLVFFHTLKGVFNNGWRYNNGKVTGTISQNENVITTDKKVLYVAAPSCQTVPVFSTQMVCTSNGSGSYDFTCTEYTTTNFITICDYGSNNPTGGPSNTGNTGTGGSGGGITTAPNPNPLLNKLMKNLNALSQTDKDLIEALLNKMNKDCIGKAIYNYFSNNNVTFDFATNSSMSAEASYNPSNDLISIKDPSTTAVVSFQEELFHAYQNKTYPNGTVQYLNAPGSANIEFESKVIRDLDGLISSTTGGSIRAINSSAYLNWLSDISSGFTSYPTSFTSSQSTQYFNFLPDFLNQNPGYSNTQIDNSLQPQAMFKLINSTNCNY